MIWVPLDPEERSEARIGGTERRRWSRQAGRREPAGTPPERGYANDETGYVAEWGFWKFTGYRPDWRPQVTGLDHAGDVGPYYVRGTDHLGYRLILHRRDPGRRVFVLVWVQPAGVWLAGWLLGQEGKILPPEARYWPGANPERACFMVPQHHLYPMDTLPSEEVLALLDLDSELPDLSAEWHT